MTTTEKHIAVFGDTHGHIRLMLLLCRLWQQNSGLKLDGVLQCGDIGFFPEPSRIDRATKKFAKRNREELGFSQFFRKPTPLEIDSRSEEILNAEVDDLGALSGPIFMCHGNHEDFEQLETLAQGNDISTLDYLDRLQYVRSGVVFDLAGIKVAAVGGAPEHENEKDMPLIGPRVSAAAIKELGKKDFDLLITHGGPQGIGGETQQWGSRLLRRLVESSQPRYHFFAHHGQPLPRASIGKTTCAWHNDTSFERSSSGEPHGCVHAGSMSVLRWRSRDDHELITVDCPWFRGVTGLTWDYL